MRPVRTVAVALSNPLCQIMTILNSVRSTVWVRTRLGIWE